MKMIYEVKNKDTHLIKEIDVLHKENCLEFIDPFVLNEKVKITIYDSKHIEFLRFGKSQMFLDLIVGKITKGKYGMEGFSLNVHTRCKSIEINDENLFFEYVLFVNNHKENEISIKLVKKLSFR